jgi:Zn-dependent peptidase ImmA (M78 family)
LNNKQIPKLVSYLKRKYGTDDPEEIADYLGVTIIRMPLEDVVAGFYKLLKRRKYIFLNSDIDDDVFLRVVLAHELGHAIMHPKENCAFMKSKTLLLTSRIEKQANIFAAFLLIDDDMLEEFYGYTEEQFCNCTGYPLELLGLRLF